MKISFADLGVTDYLIEALDVLQIKTPTTIQAKAIPIHFKPKRRCSGFGENWNGKNG